ncbi:hypothetical protein GmRootV213_28780 [Variovorax sp. V213]|uniref:hypothetical protein n=1 Tax=Variovorax sp. V213 TaxID=3065955 RepID=UPI0034E8CF15
MARWRGPDKGLICSWLRGVEKAKESPELAAQALRGELPSLPWYANRDELRHAGQRVSRHVYDVYRLMQADAENT